MFILDPLVPLLKYFFAFHIHTVTLTMLFSLLPLSFENYSVGPGDHSRTIFLVVFVGSFVSLTGRPNVFTSAMHLVILPLSIIIHLIIPLIGALSRKTIIHKLPFIALAILPGELPVPVFLPILKLSFKSLLIRPCFYAITFLRACIPSTIILWPVKVDIEAPSVGFVVDPVSLVNITIGADQHAFTIFETVLPLSLVDMTLGFD